MGVIRVCRLVYHGISLAGQRVENETSLFKGERERKAFLWWCAEWDEQKAFTTKGKRWDGATLWPTFGAAYTDQVGLAALDIESKQCRVGD